MAAEPTQPPTPQVVKKVYKAQVNQNGIATTNLDTTDMTVGTKTIQATYQENQTHQRGTSSGTLTINKIPTHITLLTNTNTMEIGNSLFLYFNVLNNEGNIITDDTLIRVLDGEDIVQCGYVNNERKMMITFTPESVGTHTLAISFQGTNTLAATITTHTITVTKQNTTLTTPKIQQEAHTDSNGTEYYVAGETITITGTLTDNNNNPLSNQTVQLKDGTTTIATVTTNTNGVATTDYTPTSSGTLQLQWTYDGTNTYKECTSTNKTIKISSIATIIMPEIIEQGDDLTIQVLDINGNGINNIQIQLALSSETDAITNDNATNNGIFTINNITANKDTYTGDIILYPDGLVFEKTITVGTLPSTNIKFGYTKKNDGRWDAGLYNPITKEFIGIKDGENYVNTATGYVGTNQTLYMSNPSTITITIKANKMIINGYDRNGVTVNRIIPISQELTGYYFAIRNVARVMTVSNLTITGYTDSDIYNTSNWNGGISISNNVITPSTQLSTGYFKKVLQTENTNTQEEDVSDEIKYGNTYNVNFDTSKWSNVTLTEDNTLKTVDANNAVFREYPLTENCDITVTLKSSTADRAQFGIGTSDTDSEFKVVKDTGNIFLERNKGGTSTTFVANTGWSMFTNWTTFTFSIRNGNISVSCEGEVTKFTNIATLESGSRCYFMKKWGDGYMELQDIQISYY